MSTVAYKDGVMAAESRGTSGDIIRGKVQKLFQLDDGRVVGIAGDVGYEAEFLAWLDDGARLEKKPDFSGAASFCAIVGSLSGFVVYGKELRCQEIGADFYAIGSGNEIALGAMSYGATARQAVECACKFDVYSGGEITEISAKSRPVLKQLLKQVPKHPSPRSREQGRERSNTRPQLQAVEQPSARPDGDRDVDLRR
jgi:ATP-dependent protease HslVU (ClpYQ) peptidase subunit